MPHPRMWRVITAIALVVVGANCAAVRLHEDQFTDPNCDFTVYNRTPHALEIRMGVRRFSTTPIGALNPGELLTHSLPCALGYVWIRGVPIPSQVGASVSFLFVQGQEALVPGNRVEVALNWP